MITQQIMFGTDGWRGFLDTELTTENVAAVAQAFADHLRTGRTQASTAIGYDGRRHSKHLAEVCGRVLKGNGIDVHLSDRITPTPVLSFYVKEKGLDAGIMITASHNPPDYNGVKFKSSYGAPFFTEETRKVEQLLDVSTITIAEGPLETVNLLPLYRDQIDRLIDFAAIRKSALSVLIDSMAGAGGTLVQDILHHHGCAASTIFGTPDEQFSGRLAEPIEKNLQPLSEELKRNRSSMGLATDGDADRLGVMLETGEWLSAQETILLLADYIKNVRRVAGDLVKTSSVTDKLRSAFESPTCRVHDVQVGFKYISEKMISHEIAFGAEESGGYGYRGHVPDRDGILSALLMTEMLAVSGYTSLSPYLAAKRKQFGTICYDRIDLPYGKPDRLAIVPSIYHNPPASLGQFRIQSTVCFYSTRDSINGVKILLEGQTRWLLIRASETEPMIRLYAEGQTREEVQTILQAGVILTSSSAEQTNL